MKKTIFLLALLIFFIGNAIATHNRAGEITYKQLGPLTFEVTVTTYTAYGNNQADRPELAFMWGDNTQDTVARWEIYRITSTIQRNKYTAVHTYPGPGTYSIIMLDFNRNEGVINIPLSINVAFSIKTTLQINPLLGQNNTPLLLNPPHDKAAVGQKFIHNPAAYDPDGDSLSYKLTACLGIDGKPITNYTYPESSIEPIYINPITGDLIWNTPIYQGAYNVAIEISEWRQGVKIGSLIRDMQIDVINSNNKPPIINDLKDWCVTAGDAISFTVSAQDAEGKEITLDSYGGVYEVANSKAQFKPATGIGNVSSEFSWQTNCLHVAKNPYTIIFKARDKVDFNCDECYSNCIGCDLPMTSNRSIKITVVAPAPENLQAAASNNLIALSWNKAECTQAIGYKLYRREESSGWTPSECETGVPAYTNFKLIATLPNINDTNYIDDDKKLTHGYLYCYRVISYFTDGAESYASEEACTDLAQGIPVLTNVTVDETDINNGIIRAIWSKPTEIDSTITPPPYRYELWSGEGEIGVTEHYILGGLNDTIFTDNNLNTFQKQYNYNVGVFNDPDGDGVWKVIGASSSGASIFTVLEPDDQRIKISVKERVPWINKKYTIYRQNKNTLLFEAIATTDTSTYTDTNLTNGQEYCYYVKTEGQYVVGNYPKPLINFSQKACASPKDLTPPCPPILTLTSICDEGYNVLKWTNPVKTCGTTDLVAYKIYYSSTLTDAPTLLETIEKPHAPNDTSFIHLIENQTLSGCYIVTAIDSLGNESSRNQKVCIDMCSDFSLPNVFTPNGDGKNDIFKSTSFYSVEKLDIQIFNRWGELVYKTDDKRVNWDGSYLKTKNKVSDGVYYYICDIWEKRLSGTEVKTLTGFIHVYGSSQQIIEP